MGKQMKYFEHNLVTFWNHWGLFYTYNNSSVWNRCFKHKVWWFVSFCHTVGNGGKILLRQNEYSDIRYAGKYFSGQWRNLPRNFLKREGNKLESLKCVFVLFRIDIIKKFDFW